MKRQTFHPKPTFFATPLIILCLIGFTLPNSYGASKRIAVLYFKDYSQFDSPTGCGCIRASSAKFSVAKNGCGILKQGLRVC